MSKHALRDPGTGRFVSKTSALMNKTTKQMGWKEKRKKIVKVAKKLLKSQPEVTTLEIKNKLRQKYPKVKWVQADISDTMIEVHQNVEIDNLAYIDNGHYRQYYIISAFPASLPGSEVKCTLTELAQYLVNSIGDTVTVVFEKKDGTTRTIVGEVPKNWMEPLGFIRFLEFGKDHKRINPRTLKRLYWNNIIYVLK